jgi:hypothetical protein
MRAFFPVLMFVVACGPAPLPPPPPPVSFAAKIRPIFTARCTACHYAGNLSKLDLQRPFSETEGLLGRDSIWVNASRPALVVPGKPDESFLMLKIDPSLPLGPTTEGAHMPFPIAEVTAAELADLRQWITDGANEDAFYRSNVQSVFGLAVNLGRTIGKCSYCHNAASPNSPDLVNAFGTRGVVNVDSAFGGKRVLPGDPDASSLVKKLAATVPATLGQKMPLNYAPLTKEEIELVRTWIAEGALDN